MIPWRAFQLALIPLALSAGSARGGLWGIRGLQAESNTAEALRLLDHELKDSNFAAASRRLAGLLQNKNDTLIEIEEGRLLSVHAHLQTLAPDLRKRLAEQCERDNGRMAAQTLENLQKATRSTPEEFYAIWRQHPLTEGGQAALIEGADRALMAGDAPAALAFYDLAAAQGWTADAPRAASIAAVRKLAAGHFSPVPADLVETPRTPIGPKPPADRVRTAGELPFDASWYATPGTWGQFKVFPYAVDDRIIVATWKNVLMLRETGLVIWNSPNPRSPGSFANARSDAPGTLFAPAVLCDAHGRPAIIVVRQPGSLGEKQFVLRGLRGGDGKVLWTTEAAERKTEWSYAGSPAIAGRSVCVLAASRADFASAALALCSIDAMNGQPTWTANLGVLSVLGEPLEPGALASLAEPAIDRELAIVAPNGGAVAAVDRFDGAIRWVYFYRKAPLDADGAGAGFVPRTARGGLAIPPGRYKSGIVVAGDVVVVMPQDSSQVFGLDRATGALKWKFDEPDMCGLAGASGKWTVMCGPAMIGIDTATGKRAWKFSAPGAPFTGPATIRGQTAIGMTARGLIHVNVADGKEAPGGHYIPSFKRVLLSETGKTALRDAAAERSFGTR